MIEITPHIIYDNDGELFMGYTSPLFYNTLHNKKPEKISGTDMVNICKALRRCRTFEDFPLSMRDLLKKDQHLHIGDGSDTLRLENLFFRSLADTLSKKSPVKVIDFKREYDKFWHSDYVFLYNLSNDKLHIKHTNMQYGTTLMPNMMLYYDKLADKLVIIAVEIIDVLLNKEVSSSTS